MDIQMPVMDGFQSTIEILKQVKSFKKLKSSTDKIKSNIKREETKNQSNALN